MDNAAKTFSPDLWFKRGLKVAFQSRLEPPIGTKVLLAFYPGFWLKPGLEVDSLVLVGFINWD
jgi:hypothetical protein